MTPKRQAEALGALARGGARAGAPAAAALAAFEGLPVLGRLPALVGNLERLVELADGRAERYADDARRLESVLSGPVLGQWNGERAAALGEPVRVYRPAEGWARDRERGVLVLDWADPRLAHLLDAPRLLAEDADCAARLIALDGLSERGATIRIMPAAKEMGRGEERVLPRLRTGREAGPHGALG